MKYLGMINALKAEKESLMIEMNAQFNNVQVAYEQAQVDAGKIKNLTMEVQKVEKKLKLEKARQTEQKQYLYEEVRKRYDWLKDEYTRFRKYTENELAVQESIIKKQSDIIQKMYKELRATKVMVDIPKLQQKRTAYDFKGMDFTGFAHVLNTINREIRTDLKEMQLIDSDDSDLDEPRRKTIAVPRQQFKMTGVDFNSHKSVLGDKRFSPRQTGNT
jgi:hypothetical protein